MSKLVRHAYINAIEKPLRDQAGYKEGLTRIYLRGYLRNEPFESFGLDGLIESVFLIKPEDIPTDLKVGRKVKVTIEVEE